MTQQKLRVIFLSIFLSLPARHDCLALRARRSLPDGRVTDQDVIEAINVLQRAGLARAESVDDQGRAYPAELLNQLIDSSLLMDDPVVMPYGESNDDYKDDLNQMSPVLDGLGADVPDQSMGGYVGEDEEEDERKEEEDREKDRKEEKRVLEKRPVDKEELEGLFQPTPQVATGEAGNEGTRSEKSDAEKEKIVRSEIVKLLSDDIQSSNPSGGNIIEVEKVETEESKPETDGVLRKTQTTEWIFKPDIADGMDFYPRPDGSPGGLANKEWLIDLATNEDGIPVYNNNNNDGAKRVSAMKKKRSSEPPSMPTASEDPSDPLGLKKEAVELLKIYIEQQEDENRHLARALNLATLSQVGSTDEYLEEEIDEIKRAAQNEKILETLREVIAMASQGRAGGSASPTGPNLQELEPYVRKVLNGADEFGEIKRKRMEPVMRKIVPESWSVPDVVAEQITEEMEEANDDEDEDEEINEEIKNKLRELLIRAGEEEETGGSRPIPAESIINEYNRYRLNPFLRDIYEVESAASTGSLPYVERNSGSAVDGVCDAVEVLADGCMAARSRDLMLDSEATELCDRHKLCYKCGSYFGMTPDTCDKGYMNEAAVACSLQQDSDLCHEDALALYAIMVRQQTPLSHTSYPSAPAECSTPCVYGYIVGMERRRRR